MLEAWLNFAAVVSVQLLLFVACAIYEKRLFDVPHLLWRGIPTGIVVGLLSDLVWGKFFGLWSYNLEYGAFALSLMAVLVYGLFAANVLLLQKVRFLQFFVWVMIITAAYEIANHFFSIWTYELILPLFGFLIFLVAGYFVTAVFVAGVWHFLGYRFCFIDILLKK